MEIINKVFLNEFVGNHYFSRIRQENGRERKIANI
jgi:hypothetical protein